MDIDTLAKYLPFLATTIAVTGFVYALVQANRARHKWVEAAQQYQKATNVMENYNRLVEEYKGRILDWKHLVNELGSQVEGETECIRLAFDTLAYGAVTAPDAHRRFWAALLAKAASSVQIEIVTFNRDAMIEMVKEQFGEDMAHAPTHDIEQEVEEHFDKVRRLSKEGRDNTDIVLSPYFPVHVFIFEKNDTAIFALQEMSGDGKITAYAFKTQDATLVEICRQSFLKMRQHARDFNRLAAKGAGALSN